MVVLCLTGGLPVVEEVVAVFLRVALFAVLLVGVRIIRLLRQFALIGSGKRVQDHRDTMDEQV